MPCAFGEEEAVPSSAPSGASGNDGGVLSAPSPSSSTDPLPSSLSAGSAEGVDVDSSRPSSGSLFMTSAELDLSAEWSECLVKHARHDLISTS